MGWFFFVNEEEEARRVEERRESLVMKLKNVQIEEHTILYTLQNQEDMSAQLYSRIKDCGDAELKDKVVVFRWKRKGGRNKEKWKREGVEKEEV